MPSLDSINLTVAQKIQENVVGHFFPKPLVLSEGEDVLCPIVTLQMGFVYLTKGKYFWRNVEVEVRFIADVHSPKYVSSKINSVELPFSM